MKRNERDDVLTKRGVWLRGIGDVGNRTVMRSTGLVMVEKKMEYVSTPGCINSATSLSHDSLSVIASSVFIS